MSRENRPKMKQAVSVGRLINDLLEKRGLEDKVREYRTWQIWDETVGPQIAARARPVRIRDGVLEIRVDQPIWMQQLQLMSRLMEPLMFQVMAIQRRAKQRLTTMLRIQR